MLSANGFDLALKLFACSVFFQPSELPKIRGPRIKSKIAGKRTPPVSVETTV